jgi:hypothetical protein
MYSLKQLCVLCNKVEQLHGYLWQIEVQGMRVAYIQTYLTQCCGLNALQTLNLFYFDNPKKVNNLLTWLKTAHPTGYYPIHHLTFTCGVGKRYKDDPEDTRMREDAYIHLINHPCVSKLHQYPSASEPGHDIGVFFIDLTKI